MSSISSIGSSPDLVQLLKQANGQGTQSATNRQSGRAAFEAKAKAAGIDIEGLKGLHKEMQTAVQDALKNADPSADRQATIQSAIDGVLKNHGYDPAKLKAQFEAAGLKGPGTYDASGKVSGHRTHENWAAQSPAQGTDADGDQDGSTSIAATLKNVNGGSLIDVAA